ncbi:MAG: DUF6427 family protein [Prolixibacteraceae bacterium]|jgi:hypothetical protein
MLLKALKSNQSYHFILIPFIAGALWLNSFIHPVSFPFFQGEDTMVLYKPLNYLLANNQFVSSLTALVFVVLLAFLILKLNVQYAFIRVRTFLPSSLFIVITSGMHELHAMHPVYPATLFLVLAVDRIFGSYDNEVIHSNAFEAGIFLAIGSLFYLNLVFFAPFLWIGFSVLKPKINWRDYVLTTLGFLLPWFAVVIYYLIVGETDIFYQTLEKNMTTHQVFFKSNLPIQIYMGYLVLLTILGSVHLLGQYDEKKISSRKYFKVFFYIFLISCVLIVAAPAVSQEIIVLLTLPLTYLISNYLISMKHQIWGEVFLYVLVAGVIYLQFI